MARPAWSLTGPRWPAPFAGRFRLPLLLATACLVTACAQGTTPTTTQPTAAETATAAVVPTAPAITIAWPTATPDTLPSLSPDVQASPTPPVATVTPTAVPTSAPAVAPTSSLRASATMAPAAPTAALVAAPTSAPAAAAPTTAPAATPTTTVAAPTAAPIGYAPDATVRDYYVLLNARQFRTAWNLLSPSWRSHLGNDYDRWIEGFRDTRSVEATDVQILSASSDEATVQLTIVSVDNASSGGSIRKTFAGRWQLVWTDGQWELDNPSIKQVE